MKIDKLFIMLIALAFNLSAYDFVVIKNPKPNIVEKEYKELVKIQELTAELQDDDFIFKPFSITGDGNGHIYIYDDVQAKVFKLDHQLKILGSFGQTGSGPGDFFGNRMGVYLSFGLDGYLYARDMMAWKVMKFSRDFKFIRQYRYHRYGNFMQGGFSVDLDGNIYLYKIKDNMLTFRNQDEKMLMQIPVCEEDVGSLFWMKPKEFSEVGCIRLVFAHNPILLVLFQDTSTLLVIKENKVVKRMNLWPRDALADYKSKLKRVVDRPMKGFTSLFYNFFIDGDDKNVFYLQYGKNETKGINALYKFTLNGELLKVLFIRSEKAHVRFLLNQGNKFFAISGEKLLVYMEEKK